MKKSLYILILIFLQITIGSCTDDALYESPDSGTSSLKIVLNVPVDNGRTRGLIYGPDEYPYTENESKIADVRVLAFNKSNNTYLGQFISYITGTNTLMANIDVKEVGTNELTVVVLANLQEQENGNELISTIASWEKNSITKEQALKALEYSFSQKWDLSSRLLPMWGETNITPIEKQTVEGSINLYRAVSKINVVVNDGEGKKTTDGTDVFKLKSIRVYYARTSGLAGSLHAPVANTEGSNTITAPSMPTNVNHFPRYNESGVSCLVYESSQEGGSYAIENQIYVPESDQKDTSKEPMCLVVGGYYMGSSEETFYRVDFKQGNKGTEFYNAIRNHIYNFNIQNVTRPGTDEPDPALDHVVVGMDVTIKDWTTEWMRGIGGQYTLDVSTGGFVLAASNVSKNDLLVNTTHNEGWTISSKDGDWFTVEKKADGSGVTVTAKGENNGGQRRGSFVITSGNLSKVIMVRQKGKGTANCYIVSDKGDNAMQDLIVTVKGNGEEGLIADGHMLQDQEPNLEPDDVKIIWETAKGLVSLKTDAQGKAIINENGIVQFKIDLTKQNDDIKKSNYPNQQGGNALIGAFKNGEIIWTWHLWVCPDLDSDGNGTVDEDELDACTQTWNTGYGYGYHFLDRYLGALNNKPGLSSLGLLYQWGRKDPFIGAASISEAQRNNRMKTVNLNGYDWKNSSKGDQSIDYATKNPTTLINGTISGVDYKFLWGTDKGFSTVRDAGNKTIYDPCPPGYRVPPVSSIVFKYEYTEYEWQWTGGLFGEWIQVPVTKSVTSDDTNYNYNVTWWPNKNSYISPSKTDSYGFWLNYMDSGAKPSGVKEYSERNNNNKNNVSVTNATWLPLAGVYDGNINEFAKVDDQNSLTVNSIIWTNSSVSTSRPGALFLHGRETDSSGNGRHLHRLIETSNNLFAKSTHAGSVRCIRDTKASVQNAIQVPAEITLNAANGSSVNDYLTSITESWEVEDPGAMWFVMTPDQGGAGSRQEIKFTATSANTTGAVRQATLIIKFSDGTKKEIVVKQNKR